MRLFHREPERIEPDTFMVVGLGNPGSKYRGTRHNVGAMAVERLADRHDLQLRKSKLLAETARGQIGGRAALLALPLTYMNESGLAVSRLANYYKVPPDRTLVVYDEMDLPFGTLRLRPSGSAAGHNGIRSIIQALGTDRFPRLRIGVGRPGERRAAIGHVLGPFPPEQESALPELLDVAGRAIESALIRGVQQTMNEFNQDWLPELESYHLHLR
jgi:PTH1 family peptidyl-tRNA hydrolase